METKEIRPKVSVIVPIYNAEKYIEKCLDTLFNQTLDRIEYIFINDCTPDNSISILLEKAKLFPNLKDSIKIINNKQNIGVGQSRQIGIDCSKGEYIIHCDPDDWVELNMYQEMYERGKINNADIIVCDYFKEKKNTEIVNHQPIFDNKSLLFSWIAQDKIAMVFWNKMVKAELAKKYKIHPGIDLWEDMSVMTPLLLEAKKVYYINEPLYHYNQNNTSSISHNISINSAWSMYRAAEVITRYIETNGIKINEVDLLRLQWSSKIGFAKNLNKETRETWLKSFPRSNNIYKLRSFNIKSKIITLCLLCNQVKLLKILFKIFD